jgi:hypothetical protein
MKETITLGDVSFDYDPQGQRGPRGEPIPSLTTDGLKSADSKADKMDWGFLDSDEMDALNEDLHNARVDGAEAMLLALLASGAIYLGSNGVKEALQTTIDVLGNAAD